jgi:hypothetical protein
LIVSTDLVPRPTPLPDEWWYYGSDHGQHVSFYTLPTLQYIAEKIEFSLNLEWRQFSRIHKRQATNEDLQTDRQSAVEHADA